MKKIILVLVLFFAFCIVEAKAEMVTISLSDIEKRRAKNEAYEKAYEILLKAIDNDDVEVFQKLNNDYKEKRDYHLYLAISKKSDEIFKFLMNDSIDIKQDKLNSLLLDAIIFRNVLAIKYLLDAGADVNWKKRHDDLSHIELVISKAYDENKEIVSLLLKYGAIADKNQLLFRAIQIYDFETINFLIDEVGVDVCIRNKNNNLLYELLKNWNRYGYEGNTYIYDEACEVRLNNPNNTRIGEEEFVEKCKLIEDIRNDKVKENEYKEKKRKNRKDQIWKLGEKLIEKGVDVNDVVDREGRTILLELVKWGEYDVIEFLLEHGADINVSIINDEGKKETILTRAPYNKKIFELLLAKGVIDEIDNVISSIKTDKVIIVNDVDGKKNEKYKKEKEEIIKILKNAKNIPVKNIENKYSKKTDKMCEKVIYPKYNAFLLEKAISDGDVEKFKELYHNVDEEKKFYLFKDALESEISKIRKIYRDIDGKIKIGLVEDDIVENRKEITNILIRDGACNIDEFDCFEYLLGYKKKDALEILINRGFDVNMREYSTSPNSKTPLMAAACYDKEGEIVELLIERGAKISDTDDKGYTPLFHAAECKNTEAMKILIDNGADVLIKSKYKYSVLDVLFKGWNDDELTKLNNDNDWLSCLNFIKDEKVCEEKRVAREKKWQIKNEQIWKMGEKLIEMGIDVKKDVNFKRFLEGDLNAVNFLLLHGVNPNEWQGDGSALVTTVKVAKYEKHKKIVELLLKHGARKGIEEALSVVSLMLDVQVEYLDKSIENDSEYHSLREEYDVLREIKKMLLEANNIEYQSKSNNRVSNYINNYKNEVKTHEEAEKQGNESIARNLLSVLNGINDYDKDGYTVLMSSVIDDNVELVKQILEKNPDVNIKSKKFGNTALMFAINNGNIEIVNKLLEKGADINIKDKAKESAIVYAVRNNNTEIVKILISKGADINVQEWMSGMSLIDYAKNNCDAEIVELLEKNNKI